MTLSNQPTAYESLRPDTGAGVWKKTDIQYGCPIWGRAQVSLIVIRSGVILKMLSERNCCRLIALIQKITLTEIEDRNSPLNSLRKFQKRTMLR
jgi:hypothetical protein